MKWLQTLTDVRWYIKKQFSKISWRSDAVTVNDVILKMLSKMWWRHQKIEPQNHFYFSYLKRFMNFQSNKGSTNSSRWVETKISSFWKCRIFLTSSSKYDVTASPRQFFWRILKLFRWIHYRAKFHHSNLSLRVFL